jgi:outer membrane protein OmpA-like peptidoglycan-associated protein|nr:OmpA family protein [Kofleriaceae bacterium]
MHSRKLAWLACLAPIVGVCRLADAQVAGDGVRPALDARGYLTVDGSQTLDRGDISFGLGALDWGHDLHAPGAMPLSDAMTATLAGAIGLPLGFELAATQPISVVSGLGQGTGDLGVHLKAQVIDGKRHAIGASVIARVYLPTASGDTAMMSPAGTIPEIDGVLDAHAGRLRVAVTAGARWERDTRTLPVGAAAAYAIVPERFEAVAEVTGTFGLAQQPATAAALEGLGGVKLYMAKNSYLTLAAGRGLETSGASDTRALISIVFEPKPAQLVHESIEAPPDSEPPPAAPVPHDEPPAPPADPEPLDLSQIVESQIVILKPINFEFDKAVITADSFPVLDAVASTLARNPDIQLVEIGGHTDERGSAAYNLDLSARRAAAVVDYLVAHGIDHTRLGSRGYGLTKPIDPGHDEDAWAKNRRVEFTIVTRAI